MLAGIPAQESENKGIVDHHTVMRWIKKANVIQSMSRAGNPHENAATERFWGRFKDTL